MLLAIETSCDETAVSLFDYRAYLAGAAAADALIYEKISSQAEMHAAYGGVVPELAAREHLLSLPLLIEQASHILSEKENKAITAIAVTQGPGLKGCLLVGVSFAKSYALANSIPLIPVHHIEAHLLSALLSSKHYLDGQPSVALVVSGGHTELYSITGFREYRRIAKTLDDAAGEAFDKSATLLGLPYPGGPRLAALAKTSQADKRILAKYRVSEGVPHDESAFSFSGLKTDVCRVVAEAQHSPSTDWKADVAAACEIERLRAELGVSLAAAGCELLVPSTFHCTDNASMIAVCAAEQIRKFGEAAFDIAREPKLAQLAARPRFPLIELLQEPPCAFC